MTEPGRGRVVCSASYRPASDPPPAGFDGPASIARIRFTAVTPYRPELARYLTALRETRPAGGALAATFRLDDVDAGAQWLLRRDPQGSGLAGRFCASPVAITVFGAEAQRGTDDQVPRLTALDPLRLAGELAVTLAGGGAHERFDGPTVVARDLADAAAYDLIDDRYGSVIVHRTHDPWVDWFHLVAWDATWLVTDAERRTVTLIATTDTD